MGWDGMWIGWDALGWTRIRWDGMEWGGMGLVGMGYHTYYYYCYMPHLLLHTTATTSWLHIDCESKNMR